MMKRLLAFFRDGSENRTNFFIIMGFIILPIVCMSYVFYIIVLDENVSSSQRMKIPTQLLESQP